MINKTISVFLFLCLIGTLLPQKSKAQTLGQLKIYTAKVTMKRPLRDSYFKGQTQTFKKGAFITDSQADSYTISNYNKLNYLYGGSCDSDYTSCLIPKANVSVKTYEMGEMPVSVVGDGITYTDNKGITYRMFIGNANGHKFYPYDDDFNYHYDKAVTDAHQKFFVLVVNGEEFIVNIIDNKIQLYENGKCKELVGIWRNGNVGLNIPYSDSSFDNNGNLLMDMYMDDGKSEFMESVCYIPSLNSLYVGNGVFIPLDQK